MLHEFFLFVQWAWVLLNEILSCSAFFIFFILKTSSTTAWGVEHRI